MKTAYSITELNQQTLCQTLIQANKVTYTHDPYLFIYRFLAGIKEEIRLRFIELRGKFI